MLDDAVMKALALDREERYQTAGDFSKPLRGILEKVDRRVTAVGLSATQYSGPPPVGAEERLAKTVRGLPRSGR